jgi:NTP-dependent ternary system trypsin peptidase co-occuring protein
VSEENTDPARTEIVRAQLGDKTTILIEARTAPGDRDVSATSDALDFSGVTGSIESIAADLTAVFARVKPRKASVEFGVEVGIESGKLTALLVKGTGKANLKVTLSWE